MTSSVDSLASKPGHTYWTARDWSEIEHCARQARTLRAYAAAGKRHGNEPQRLGMECSAKNYERELRRFARAAIASATQEAS
jgi:hypothetical protein